MGDESDAGVVRKNIALINVTAVLKIIHHSGRFVT